MIWMNVKTWNLQLKSTLALPFVLVICFSYSITNSRGQESEADEVAVIKMPKLGEALTEEQVDSFARLALKNIQILIRQIDQTASWSG